MSPEDNAYELVTEKASKIKNRIATLGINWLSSFVLL